jgi:hypothetical protein
MRHYNRFRSGVSLAPCLFQDDFNWPRSGSPCRAFFNSNINKKSEKKLKMDDNTKVIVFY